MPFDSHRNAARFISVVEPTLAIMVRYDIWPNHIWALRKRGIPVLIANATLREGTARMLPVIKQFHGSVYRAFECILTVSESDRKAFASFGVEPERLAVIGDTRYDQVWQRSAESRTRRILPPAIVGGRKVLVVGSSWQGDEEVLLPAALGLDILVVLVPHEPNVENLERIEQELNGSASFIRFSNLTDYRGERVIIIDSVGILVALYQYAHVAYVGGGFGAGVHNVLEPAVYGVPVLFGPRYENSQEAVQLMKEGAAFAGRTTEEFSAVLTALFSDEGKRRMAGEAASALVKQNIGATDRFISYVEKLL
jgi:3-deoxy-D-manno-octulosonic-acid transferase